MVQNRDDLIFSPKTKTTQFQKTILYIRHRLLWCVIQQTKTKSEFAEKIYTPLVCGLHVTIHYNTRYAVQ